MSHISEHIFKLYNQLSEDEIQPIDDNVVVNAINIINRISVNNSDSLFYFLTAMNLLNAAIKTAQHKSQLSHAFIKTRVSKIADKILQNPSSFTETYLFYDNAQKCMYFEVYDVIFSFHQILETKLIKNIASKRNRIQWTGIRLQRIAQNIYLYAEQLFDNSCKDDSEMKSIVINKINNEKKFDEASNTKLFPCPDCGKEISIHAKMCPQCGNDLCANNELMDGIKEGYSIKITFNGNSNSGVLKTIDRHFVTLALIDEKWVKIRTSAIDSIELIDTNEISTELLAQQAEAFFLRIFELSNIDKDTLISTNSTITQVDKLGLTIIKDSGEIATCVKPGIVGYKKKECTIGKRVYCGNIGTKGRCYNSIVEMTYGELIDFFHKAVSHSKNITQTRRAQIISILTYLMKEMTTTPEVYLEIKKFKKKVKDFLEQLNLEGDNFSESEETLENNEEPNNIYLENNESQETHIYKTETEKLLEEDGFPQPKVLGKIDLDTLSGKKKNIYSSSAPNAVTIQELSKPMILSSTEVNKFINKKLINLSEAKCKQLEKELDTLIRNGEKEECLRRSYQIINTSRPTPKYLRSYLDRIVNTEIALDHTSEALQSLALLIVLTEQQEDASVSSLGHLYITMARLYLKELNKDEAQKAILYAESLRPNNNAVSKLKDSIFHMSGNTVESKGDAQNIINSNENTNTNDDSISGMLLEDVRQEAKRQELLPVNAIIPAEQLFGKAQSNRNNSTESFEDKAQLFLEAAGAYYNSKQTSTIMYKISVANYARLKGHSMYAKFANLIRNNSGELIELQAYRDSACSYYLEALGIFNVLGQKNHLQELFLKYLQLSIVVSNIEGGKTPADNWEQWTLNQLQLDCIKADGLEEKRILFKTCISVGTAAEGAWNTLYSDKDGLNPFISRFRYPKFKEESFSLFNDIEKSEISSDLQPGIFLHKVFEHRLDSLNRINEIIEDCLKWQYSSFDISTFELIFKKLENYRELFTSTDLKAITAINEVIEILKPYAGRKENERTRSLVRSQQVLLNTQKDISNTTTYYGKIFFSILTNKWLMNISKQLEERDASTFPVLNISCEPAFITKDENGNGVISIVVTNDGDSTAQSFEVSANVNGKEYTIYHETELSAGDCCGENFASMDFSALENVDVTFKLIAKYQGKELNPTECQATYEVESKNVLSDEIDIPWDITKTPEEHIFKGREKVLETLVDHYLSKDRTLTYILYGLTRTGKSSILEYLRNRINGQSIKENPDKKIYAFKWSLNDSPYKNSSTSQFWAWALETNIYNALPDALAEEIDSSYGEEGLPPADKLSQLDFVKIINVLNLNNIIPLITIDEFSFVRLMLKEGLLDATFVSTLRTLALTGKACFIYSGTYDIKDLPKEKEYIAGQMNNTLPMHINQIDEIYANELIDACPKIIFDDKAKAYIRALSGCVPYWIQWICLACGKYAVKRHHRHLGFNEVNYVVNILTGENLPGKFDTWESLDETNFHDNQIDPNNIAEHQLISSISYLNRESTQIERGISMDELKRLWDKYSVNAETRLNMTRALASLKDKKILHPFTDEGREVYRLNVDLFRRWWFVHHKDLDLEFSL